MSDSLWHDAVDGLRKIEDELDRRTVGSPTIDQRLKITQIRALLAIGQELSAINPQNTTTHGEGGARNGWGLPIPD